MNIKKVLLALMSVSMVSVAAKADSIQLGDPAYGGNGCPAGSASVTMSPDQSQLSILFDEYLVEAGGDYGRRIARKSCNIAIPVHVPQGYSVAILGIDYRGYTYVPRGAQAKLSVEYFFAGRRGPRYSKTFRGPKDDEYLVENNLIASSLVWSACGANTILRANTSMMGRTNRHKDELLATVDSVDVEAGLIYHLQWRRCR
tara:strand:- start:246158 stop:246760 length:603 start_codon:yes stop_codon:yes gene_type:complete